VPIDTFQTLVVSLVLTRLDFINGVLASLPVYLVRGLQSVLNAAARLTYRLRRSDHITDALVCLHWLRVSERVQFKIAILTYKVLHGFAPQYLSPLDRVADLRCLAVELFVLLALVVWLFCTSGCQPSPTGLSRCRPTDLERSYIPADVTSTVY